MTPIRAEAGGEAGAPRGGLLTLAGVAGLVALITWAASLTGDPYHAGPAVVWILLTDGGLAAWWLVAAAGLGWPLRLALVPRGRARLALQAALGVAALLTLDGALGRLGLLQAGGRLGAATVLAAGTALLVIQAVRARRTGSPPGSRRRLDPLLWLGTPALAALVVAACSPPGWLWASEFGGYDVLSYHQQLPAEWLARGRLAGTEHNVYGFLPSAVEAAFYHLAVLSGDAVRRATASQMLHGGLALLTAALTATAAGRVAGRRAGAVAAVVVIGTPWTVVTGSMAYNEMAVTALLAGSMVLLLERSCLDTPVRSALALGLLVGAACAAKATAVGFVAAPVAVVLAVRLAGRRPRAVAPALAAMAGAALLALAPALLANLLATGNPVFPFATTLFGPGPWTEAQAAIWAHGHAVDAGLGGRLAGAWNELLRYGLGPAPDPREPWAPQWSVLPWLTIIAAAFAWGRRGERRGRRTAAAGLVAMIALQLVFWLALTHVKSRFMVPAIPPAAVLVALAARPWVTRPGPSRHVLGAALLAFASLPLVLFARERDERPAALVGRAFLLTGEAHAARIDEPGLPARARAALIAEAPLSWYVHHGLDADARILGVGAAAPLYLWSPAFTYQTTWDRGPLSRAMAAAPDDPAAWITALRTAGYTHVLLDPVMLALWEAEGWNDPALTLDRVRTALRGRATLVATEPSGPALYRLGP